MAYHTIYVLRRREGGGASREGPWADPYLSDAVVRYRKPFVLLPGQLLTLVVGLTIGNSWRPGGKPPVVCEGNHAQFPPGGPSKDGMRKGGTPTKGVSIGEACAPG